MSEQPSSPSPTLSDIVRCVAIAAAGATLLAATHYWTGDRIAANRNAAELRSIAQLLRRTEDTMAASAEWQADRLQFGDDAVLRTTVRGYGGPMLVLIGTNANRLTGVAVSEHTETPGLGDFFNGDDGAWLRAAADDYPDIDTVTGATITSRAIIRAIESGLERGMATGIPVGLTGDTTP